MGLKAKERENAIIREITWVGILGNILLTLFKLWAGIYGHSVAMLSDAIHSLSDVFATFIAYLGVKLAKRPANQKYPYGHDRIESIASLVLGLILVITGLGIGKVGLTNIFSGHYEKLAIPEMIALVAALVSIAVKEAMFWYTRYYAKIINSSAFMADAWHHRSDALSSVGSFIGIGGAMLGFPVLDSVASVVICLIILKVAFDILRDALANMLDMSWGADKEKTLVKFVLAHKDVVGVDFIRSRMFGSRVYVDLEIKVDGNMKLHASHAVAEEIHENVEQEFADIKHIMIHVNPASEEEVAASQSRPKP